MNLRLIAVFFTGVALIPASAETQDQKVPTLDELVTKNIEAKGGADALRSAASARIPFAHARLAQALRLTPGAFRVRGALLGSA